MDVKTDHRFIDIGVNLTDPVFTGLYHGKRKHDDDFEMMLQRSRNAGVHSMIITGGSLSESEHALSLARKHGLYATIGCHPTRSTEFESFSGGPEAYLAALDTLISKNMQGKGRVVAVGECGLDYDRTHFATPETQKKYFRIQLSLAKKHKLPLFLHSRAAHRDLVIILQEEGYGNGHDSGGVVHSFTGSESEASELMKMGFYMSVNGCSLKTEENLQAAKTIVLERLILETDAPWCSMTSTHASHRHLASLPPSLRALYFPDSTKPEKFVMGKPVKSRNESTAIGGVAWVMHKLHDVPFEVITEEVWRNTVRLFSLPELEEKTSDT